ncbi:MAG: group II intron maturase-specific domain-containing protein, partial [Blastocatellia bacterium]
LTRFLRIEEAKTSFSMPIRRGKYPNLFPAKQAVEREVAALHDLTSKRQSLKPLPGLIEEINRQTQGWSNYFKLGYPAKVFKRINGTILTRLEQHLNRRRGASLQEACGRKLLRLFQAAGRRASERTRNCLISLCAENQCVSRMREIRPSGSRREEAAAKHGIRLLRHARGNPETDYGGA